MAITKNLISFNKSLFDGFSSIVIPALIGIAVAQNPHETIQIESAQASWLCKCEYIYLHVILLDLKVTNGV